MNLGILLYLIASCIFIIVGLLHTYVHKVSLTNEKVKNKIKQSGTIRLGKKPVEILKLWEGMSLLFGIMMVVIGVLNIISWYDLRTLGRLSSSVCLLNIGLLGIIIYSGVKFFGNMQIYGGVLGLILFGLAMLLS